MSPDTPTPGSSPAPGSSPGVTADAEADLLARARRGDRAALGELLARHEALVYRVCYRMLGHREDAAEAAQDAIVKIIQHIDGFRGEARLTTWITRIAMNQALSRMRRNKVRRAASMDQPASHNGFAKGAGGDDALHARLADSREPLPDQRIEQEEAHRRLQRAIDGLDEPFRAVLVLRDLEQMPYDRIAEVLELSVGTVKSRLFRARLSLRQTLSAPGSAPGSIPGRDPGKSSDGRGSGRSHDV